MYFLWPNLHLRDRTDWILNPELFNVINQQWGPLEVHLFASRFSAQLPLFYSWRPDPEVEATDAFAQDWSANRGYAHPPWCLITWVLFKVQAQQASLVLVAPVWPTQVWLTVLVSMLVDIPILLPMKQIPPPNCDCPVQDTLPRQFQRRLSNLYWPPGEIRQMLTITLPGESGNDDAPQELSIPFQQVYQKSKIF